jgi:hypothetical protein
MLLCRNGGRGGGGVEGVEQRWSRREEEEEESHGMHAREVNPQNILLNKKANTDAALLLALSYSS